MTGLSRLEEFPRISIITPCFNSGAYLEETILSVLEQNYPNLEYIIIDGGSSDNTLNIVKKYEKKLTYWESEKDNGMYDAIQKGFCKSTGEILAWINADDIYHKKAFFIISEIFENYQNINWVVGAAGFWDESGRGVHVGASKRFTRYDFLMGDYKFIPQESCFFRRSLYKTAGSCMNTALRYAGDFELWLRFFRHDELYVVDALIAGYRVRTENQLSLEGMPRYIEEAQSILASEVLSKSEKRKIMRYKMFYNSLNRLSKFLVRVLNKYRRIEFGKTKDIKFDRMTQRYKLI